MRASRLFFPTLREAPRDAELTSHQLLLRGGFVRPVAAGVYSYLPLGWRVHEKIARIVREEIDAFGGQEVRMPVLVPKELLDESGRSSVPVLFALKDRAERDYFLGFTHEEVVTDIVRTSVSSWKQMPLYLYQISTKERDEPRPRGGLLRGREFTMFDGYSFDVEEQAVAAIYRANYAAYESIFRRCGLASLAVEADPGAIGGSENHEFMVLADSGEDAVLLCDRCGYAANAERAEVGLAGPEADASTPGGAPLPASRVVSTPGAHTVEEVCAFLGAAPETLIKTIICTVDGAPVAALVRGDRELNLPKLMRALGAHAADLANAGTVVRVSGAPVGFAGPVELPAPVPIWADHELNRVAGYVVGANAADAHRTGAVPGRDFAVTGWADLRTAAAGDLCPRCAAKGERFAMREQRGIEVGHIFKLGTKYSAAMGALYQTETGEKRPILMGCYGLGVSRTMAAAVEAHSDGCGIDWPISLAPYEVAVILADGRSELQRAAAERLYAELSERGIEVLLDDRSERIGVKFKDMELIGIPVQVVVGKLAEEGAVELGRRGERERRPAPLDAAAELAAETVSALKRALVTA